MCDFCAAAAAIEDLRDRVSTEERQYLRAKELARAIELADEMIGYVPPYFCDKYEMEERLAALRRTLQGWGDDI